MYIRAMEFCHLYRRCCRYRYLFEFSSREGGSEERATAVPLRSVFEEQSQTLARRQRKRLPVVEVVGVLDKNLTEDVRIADAEDWGVTLKVAEHSAVPLTPFHRGLKLALCTTDEGA